MSIIVVNILQKIYMKIFKKKKNCNAVFRTQLKNVGEQRGTGALTGIGAKMQMQ